jgi:hypothetical protein
VEKLSSGIDRLTRDLLLQLPPGEVPLAAWPLVCGANVAARTTASRIEHGVLTVQVPSREWNSELESLKARYLQRLNELCPEGLIDIRFECKVIRP